MLPVSRQSLRRFFENGTQVGSDNTASLTLSAITQFSVGARIDNVAFLTGNLAELVLYSRRLSDLERVQVEQYLLARYALG